MSLLYAMGVSAEVAQRVLGSAEGPLGIDDPVVTEQNSEPCGKASWFRERCKVAVELDAPPWNAIFRSARNLPRKTRPSAWTGRKKVRREEIQLA
jgi:hypothetical protein